MISLTTDFGIRDGFPAAMHGVILSINPDARIIDITHAISPGNIAHGAYILTSVSPYFPENTIHVVVVDPGVGTSRSILVVKTKLHTYIAPDNGLLGYILEQNPQAEVRVLANSELWLDNPSSTFHGRDIMAPTAAHLSNGISFSDVGPIANSWEPAPFPPVKRSGDVLYGHIIHIDHFGNLITNISGECRGIIHLKNHQIEKWVKSFGEADPGHPAVLIGSANWLEIVAKDDSAADMLNVSAGDRVELHLKE